MPQRFREGLDEESQRLEQELKRALAQPESKRIARLSQLCRIVEDQLGRWFRGLDVDRHQAASPMTALLQGET
ncbi:hypothetical protein [Novosphingobium sp. Gsoil 351]|uniref:hypothetical protein n=1 Tax=Novosphingobium sp. Gsoil 351 TaxID=2675225 RepID=UPI0012B4957F|nr:hypothetical protein [Novosphingobium sp. Gsoil 351]QGN54969.1 hypothetical protein GKE62_10795 [Novosphingobium sp. Gsoil 351]